MQARQMEEGKCASRRARLFMGLCFKGGLGAKSTRVCVGQLIMQSNDSVCQ